MRLILLFTALAVVLGLAVMASQTPAPRPISTPAEVFSAARAMADVREIARAPHPVGSDDHARVQAYLMQRMTALGLTPQIQTGPLSPRAVQRMEREGRSAQGLAVANLVGVLPGRDPDRPAVLMMAHYDSVPGSPGAADDATGVAAILEAVRAIRARGGADRDLIVLLTDAEELNLDGARVFFAAHPWRDRIGAVVNLEARGGGGVWLLAAAVVAGQAVRVLAGPLGGRVQSPETYYTLLRRLPVLEIGVALALSGLALLLIAGRAGGRAVAFGLVAAAALTTALSGGDPVVLGAAAVAVGLGLWPRAAEETPWGGWLGLIALVLVLGAVVQAMAPEAAFLLIWPAVIAALTAAAAALISARLTTWTALIPAALATAVVGGWLLMQAHGVFLGVGMDLPGVLGVIALLILLLARPLSPSADGGVRALSRIAGGLVVAAMVAGLGARLIA